VVVVVDYFRLRITNSLALPNPVHECIELAQCADGMNKRSGYR